MVHIRERLRFVAAKKPEPVDATNAHRLLTHDPDKTEAQAMNHLHVRPRGANSPDQPDVLTRRDAVHWNDPADIKLWIFALRGEIDDVIAACEDATRPQADRVLSRAETRRRLLAAETQIARLLDAGERSLDAPSAAAAP